MNLENHYFDAAFLLAIVILILYIMYTFIINLLRSSKSNSNGVLKDAMPNNHENSSSGSPYIDTSLTVDTMSDKHENIRSDSPNLNTTLTQNTPPLFTKEKDRTQSIVDFASSLSPTALFVFSKLFDYTTKAETQTEPYRLNTGELSFTQEEILLVKFIEASNSDHVQLNKLDFHRLATIKVIKDLLNQNNCIYTNEGLFTDNKFIRSIELTDSHLSIFINDNFTSLAHELKEKIISSASSEEKEEIKNSLSEKQTTFSNILLKKISNPENNLIVEISMSEITEYIKRISTYRPQKMIDDIISPACKFIETELDVSLDKISHYRDREIKEHKYIIGFKRNVFSLKEYIATQ